MPRSAEPTGTPVKEYVDLVINEMMMPVAAEGLADFVDVLQGFFRQRRPTASRAGRDIRRVRFHADWPSRNPCCHRSWCTLCDHLEALPRLEQFREDAVTMLPTGAGTSLLP